MVTVTVVISSFTFNVVYGRILLYNTENSQAVEKFDCVYFTNNDGDEITYCQRPGGTLTLSRNKADCDNGGKRNYFRDLLDQGIEPNEVVKWNSSVEMADLYASIFLNRSLIENYRDGFICHCTRIGTFGKYCEYQLTHHTSQFSDAVKAQFYQKKAGDSWDTQRHGDILCYTMLNCYAGLLCLDWREICDGVQRCWYGIDEENRDKLEFNECEDDEFRCTNGMCIAEEFWFDGDRDCMDWSDEYLVHDGDDCPFTPNAME